ncbi:MAG: hypothetical protein HOE90_23795 [Bacteriovoracaceae bacterium]|jgi:hypothetical protein|nr:hypothetical protein [Bacteriovoracaceae bacterium]
MEVIEITKSIKKALADSKKNQQLIKQLNASPLVATDPGSRFSVTWDVMKSRVAKIECTDDKVNSEDLEAILSAINSVMDRAAQEFKTY